MIAGHIHNSRCMWIKMLGKEHGIRVPRGVNRHRVGRKELIPALNRSSRGIISLLQLGCDRGGSIPGTSSYVWRNLPLDVGHFLAYFVAHEGHHRGQIVMLAREPGLRLPAEVTGGLWQWTKRATEARSENLPTPDSRVRPLDVAQGNFPRSSPSALRDPLTRRRPIRNRSASP